METTLRFLVLSSICVALITTVTAKAGALAEPSGKETKPAQQEDKEDKEELEALPNKLADYDSNADGLLYYEEFAHAIMSANNMTDPSELRGLFNLCDENGDDKIDEDEFKASPLAGDSESQKQVSQFGFRLCYWRVKLRCYYVWFLRRICKVYYYRYCF